MTDSSSLPTHEFPKIEPELNTHRRDVTSKHAWQALSRHQHHMYAAHLRELFAADPQRGSKFVLDAADLHIDFSKNLLTQETLNLLLDLARETNLEQHRDALLWGEQVNFTEHRPALHTALRLPRDKKLIIDGIDIVPQIHETLDAMGIFTDAVRSGDWLGATGKRIKTIVNIGIGGSDLGPAMAYEALRHYRHSELSARFVSNVDPADFVAAVGDLDPATTLFIVVSKTFTTAETLTNAHAAREWLVNGLGREANSPSYQEAVRKHFVAVSTHADEVAAFGIDPANMFGFWDWVGGRYSVDSAVGLVLMAMIGKDGFREFLDGFHAIDEHFRTAPLEKNAPVILSLINLWYNNFFGAQSRAVLPYANDLSQFTDYLQQLTMESNGKSVDNAGAHVTTDTGQIFWGAPGTNGQHAFFQLLHQGTRLIPADFIGFAHPTDEHIDNGVSMHDVLMANFFAQTRVLAFGKTADEVAADKIERSLIAHKVMPGNRPSTTILAPKLSPATLGQLIALYEHQVFVEGAIWGINSFDQWGVELGKAQALQLLSTISNPQSPVSGGDSSTDALINWYRSKSAGENK